MQLPGLAQASHAGQSRRPVILQASHLKQQILARDAYFVSKGRKIQP